MIHEEGQFSAHDGLELYWQHWLPEKPPKANLAVIHGLGEHSGRYGDFAAWFVSAGYAVHAFDHRGHGRSPGQRGHIDHWSDFREDVRVFLDRVGAGACPTFLLGYSLGGLMVLDYALQYPAGVQGVVASGPILAQGESGNPLLLLAAKILSRLAPRLTIRSGLSADDLSHDRAVVEAYRADPLVHGLVTPRFGAELDATMKATLSAASQWDPELPLLVVHGGADPICALSASRQFFEAAAATDKCLHVYEGFFHESFNEVGREQPLTDAQQWLDAHVV